MHEQERETWEGVVASVFFLAILLALEKFLKDAISLWSDVLCLDAFKEAMRMSKTFIYNNEKMLFFNSVTWDNKYLGSHKAILFGNIPLTFIAMLMTPKYTTRMLQSSNTGLFIVPRITKYRFRAKAFSNQSPFLMWLFSAYSSCLVALGIPGYTPVHHLLLHSRTSWILTPGILCQIRMVPWRLFPYCALYRTPLDNPKNLCKAAMLIPWLSSLTQCWTLDFLLLTVPQPPSMSLVLPKVSDHLWQFLLMPVFCPLR